MGSSGKGGMQTSGTHYSIVCPKCKKPAARKDTFRDVDRYMHFTHKGHVWHEVKKETHSTAKSPTTWGQFIMGICEVEEE